MPLYEFLEKVTGVLDEGLYAPATEDELLQAFRVLDPADSGYLTATQLEHFLTVKGRIACVLHNVPFIMLGYIEL